MKPIVVVDREALEVNATFYRPDEAAHISMQASKAMVGVKEDGYHILFVNHGSRVEVLHPVPAVPTSGAERRGFPVLVVDSDSGVAERKAELEALGYVVLVVKPGSRVEVAG